MCGLAHGEREFGLCLADLFLDLRTELLEVAFDSDLERVAVGVDRRLVGGDVDGLAEAEDVTCAGPCRDVVGPAGDIGGSFLVDLVDDEDVRGLVGALVAVDGGEFEDLDAGQQASTALGAGSSAMRTTLRTLTMGMYAAADPSPTQAMYWLPEGSRLAASMVSVSPVR